MRYLGVLLIFLASTVLGFALAGSEQSKLRQNDGLIDLLRHIRQKIGFFKSTPGEIYATFENRELERAGFCEALRKYGEQISGCDYMLELLETNQKRLCEEYPAKKKVYSSLGMLFGMMAVLLLF